MKVSFDYPDELDADIMRLAEQDGHKNRAAVIRKALAFFLAQKSHKVAQSAQTTPAQE